MMPEKVTSIKVDSELWRAAKLLAVRRGVTLKAMIESLLIAEIEADLSDEDELHVSEKELKELLERRKRGEPPFMILSEKSAVEIVREGGVMVTGWWREGKYVQHGDAEALCGYECDCCKIQAA